MQKLQSYHIIENLDWPPITLRFTSVETVWAHSVYQTLKNTDTTFTKHYNFYEISAACLTRHSKYKTEIFNAVCAFEGNQSISKVRLLVAIVHNTTISIKKFILRIPVKSSAARGRDFIANIINIQDAQHALDDQLNRRSQFFEIIISTYQSASYGAFIRNHN